MSRLLKGLVPLAVFAGLGIFFAIGLTRDPTLLPSEMIDRPLPDFEMTTLSGEPVTQEALIGTPTLLNVFGSWCVACLVEHPVFMELSEDPDVNLIGVNWRDTHDNATQWLARHGDPYDMIVFDPESRLAIKLGVSGAPETFVLDANARIRYKHTGAVTPDVWSDTLQPLLQRLRAETP